MKQIIQNYKNGKLQLIEIPDPIVKPGGVLLETKNSLISVGTEKLIIGLAKKGYLGKALARPDLVKQFINKIKTDGLSETYRASMSRLDSPVALGYSSSGIVKEVGANTDGLKVGDRVACFGEGIATHSEKAFITNDRCVKIPENINFEQAAFVGLGAIALNAIRCANLTLGKNIVVIGLGLLGQISVQILKSYGCHVFGVDINEAKLKIAYEYGCDSGAIIGNDDVNSKVMEFTNGKGADAVIIMAGSANNEPIELAAAISREQGRIVACGMVGLNIPRQEFFKKELSVIVSHAAGLEKTGNNCVHGTSRHNMANFLQLVSEGKIKLDKIITHRFPIERSLLAYEMILNSKEPYLGVLIEYGTGKEEKKKVALIESRALNVERRTQGKIGIGLIGAGLHSNASILPVLKEFKNIELIGVADVEGFKGRHAGRKYSFEYCVSDYKELLKDEEVNAVLIATRHNLHAQMIIDALNAGKHVFVEKPLCMNNEELWEVDKVYSRKSEVGGLVLMVGFNRRFSPFTQKAKELLGNSSNMGINCRVNAGFVPNESWVQNPEEGGGRIIGEVCHFVDLIQCLSGSLPVRVSAECTAEKGEDNLVITLKMKNGSVATIFYTAQGDRLLPRERIEIFSKKSICVIDNFKSLFYAKDGKAQKKRSFSVDRGHQNEFQAFFDGIRAGTNPVNFEEYVYTTMTTFAILDSIKTGQPQTVDLKGLCIS